MVVDPGRTPRAGPLTRGRLMHPLHRHRIRPRLQPLEDRVTPSLLPGPEAQVNGPGTSPAESLQAISMNPAGQYVVTWDGVAVRPFAADGTPVTNEIIANETGT